MQEIVLVEGVKDYFHVLQVDQLNYFSYKKQHDLPALNLEHQKQQDFPRLNLGLDCSVPLAHLWYLQYNCCKMQSSNFSYYDEHGLKEDLAMFSKCYDYKIHFLNQKW